MAQNPSHYSPDADTAQATTGGAAAGSAPSGNPVLVAGQDSGPLVRVFLTDTDGTIQADVTKLGGQALTLGAGAVAAGTQRITLASNDPAVTQLTAGATAIAKAEDAASANGDVGVPAMALQNTTPIDTAGTDGDYTFLQMKNGRLWTSSNLTLGGTALDGNSGNKSAQTLRVVLATDQPNLTTPFNVQGQAASGAAKSGNPVLVGGQDGTNAQTFLTDTSGRQQVNLLLAGTAVDGNSGNKSAGTLRVVLATDQPAMTNAQPVTGAVTPGDAVSTPTTAQDVRAFLELFNNSTSDRARNSAAANISRTTQPDALSVAMPGNWALFSSPGLAVVASASKAAGGAGVRHIAQNIVASYLVGAAGVTQNILLRDGAAGVGAALLAIGFGTAAAVTQQVFVGSIGSVYGSANTVMTLEFSGVGAASVQSVNLTGWSTQ